MIERRLFATELRVSAGDDGVVSGYAALHYDGTKRTQSQNLGGFVERLHKGCFTRALASGDDVKCLFNHNPNCILGRCGNGSLTVRCDDKGLAFRCELGKQSYAQDLRESIRTGLVNQCSFGFMLDQDDPDSVDWGDDGWDENDDRCKVRNIRSIHRLLDVSPVTEPAYQATSCTARALWPEGIPVEVRSHAPNVDQVLAEFARTQRRAIHTRVMGL